MNNPRYVVVFFFVLSTLAFLLGHMYYGTLLIHPDESLYTQISIEMYRKHQFWIPFLDGKASFVKPPFVYWLEIFGFKCFGVQLWAAQLPVWVLGFFSVILTYLIGKSLIGEKQSRVAQALLLCNVFFFPYSQSDMMDVPLTFFILLSFKTFLNGVRSRSWWFVVTGSLIGFASLVKGPLGSVLSIMVILVYISVEKKWDVLKKKEALWGVVAMVLSFSAWPILVALKGYGKAWFDEFILGENFGKFAGQTMPIKILFIGLFAGIAPWTFLFVEALVKAVQKNSFYKERIFLLLWIMSIFLLFALPARKLPHYVLPVIPAACLLMATIQFSGISKVLTRIILGLIGLLWLIAVPLAPSLAIRLIVIMGGVSALSAGWVLNTVTLEWSAWLFGILLMTLPIVTPAIQLRDQEKAVHFLQGEVAVFCLTDRDQKGFEVSPKFESCESVKEGEQLLARGGTLIIPRRELKSIQIPVVVIRHWNVWKSGIGLGQVLHAIWTRDTFPLLEEVDAVQFLRL